MNAMKHLDKENQELIFGENNQRVDSCYVVGGVLRSDYFDVDDRLRTETDVLPRLTRLSAPVTYGGPVSVVG